MTVTAIFTDDGLDQVIQMDGTDGAAAIVKREVCDLRAMGCNVRAVIFPDETAAYDWLDAHWNYSIASTRGWPKPV